MTKMFAFIFELGPMNPNPITARDKLIAELQIRYRTFYVEFDINEVSYNFVHIIRMVVSPNKS
jgi:hypothetical protein